MVTLSFYSSSYIIILVTLCLSYSRFNLHVVCCEHVTYLDDCLCITTDIQEWPGDHVPGWQSRSVYSCPVACTASVCAGFNRQSTTGICKYPTSRKYCEGKDIS